MGGRIVWILNGCGLEGGSITGGPARFHEISHRWRGKGCEQLLMTTSGGETMLRRMGCRLDMLCVPASLLLSRELFRPFRFWSYAVSSLLCRRAVGKAAEFLGDGGVVITTSDYFCDIIPALLLKRIAGCRWIALSHHMETPPSRRPGNFLSNVVTWLMQRWSFRKIAHRADEAWVCGTEAGDAIRARLVALGMDGGRIRFFRNGVDTSAIGGSEKPKGKRYDAVMIGVRPNKGMADIVPIWRRVIAMRPGATLLLMGGMSGIEPLVKEIGQNGLDGAISFLKTPGGLLPRDEYYAHVKSANILMAPSHEEGWGIVLCEAMAAELPVVAYDLPAYRRIYGGDFLSVPRFDTAKFAEEIVRILGDGELADSYRRRGLERARSYDWDAIAEEDWRRLAT